MLVKKIAEWRMSVTILPQPSHGEYPNRNNTT